MLSSSSNFLISLSLIVTVDGSTPDTKSNTKEPKKDDLETSLKDEMGELGDKEGGKVHKEEEEPRLEKQEKDKVVEEEEEVEEDDSLEWELRNTDSVFSELSELSRDYVESVDRGASVRGELTQKTRFFNFSISQTFPPS